MQKTIKVVYEKGVFKPLEPVELEEGEGRFAPCVKLWETLIKTARGIFSSKFSFLRHEFNKINKEI